MKNYIKYCLISVAIILLAASCEEEILYKYPQNSINPSLYYQTEDDIINSLIPAYRGLQLKGTYGNYFITATALMSDMGFPAAGGPDNAGHMYLYNAISENNSGADRIWGNIFQGVARTNYTLANVSDADVDESVIEEVLGQALFLRSLYYYYVAMLWGDAPLILEPLSFDAIEVEVSTQSEIFQQIVSDLKTAIDYLPDHYSGVDAFRADGFAARALLARTYLYMAGDAREGTKIDEESGKSYWELAFENAKYVIDNGGFTLAPNYGDMFLLPDMVYENENNPESIFEVQFTDWKIDANDWISTQGSRLNNYLGPKADWGSSEWYEILVPKREYVQKMDTMQDARAHVNVLFPGDTILDRGANAEDALGSTGMFEQDGKIYYAFNGNTTSVHTCTERYLVRKWLYGHTVWRETGPTNVPVLRLAEMYLIVAECENELNHSSEAHTAINMVRERANIDPLSGLSKEDFRDAVLDERQIELAYEGGFRLMDLKRTRRLVDVINADRADEDGWVPIGDWAYQLYFPFAEVEVSSTMTQKPGW